MLDRDISTKTDRLASRPGALVKLVGGVERVSKGVGFSAADVDGRTLAQVSGSLARLAVARPNIPLARMARALVARGDLGRDEPRVIAAAEARDAPESGKAVDVGTRVRETLEALPKTPVDPQSDLGLAALGRAAARGRCRAVGAAEAFETLSRRAHQAGRPDVAVPAAQAFVDFALQAQVEVRTQAATREGAVGRQASRGEDAR